MSSLWTVPRRRARDITFNLQSRDLLPYNLRRGIDCTFIISGPVAIRNETKLRYAEDYSVLRFAVCLVPCLMDI